MMMRGPAKLALICAAALLSTTEALTATLSRRQWTPTHQRRSTRSLTMENFGFDFAESQLENTPQIIFGERNLKTVYVKEVTDLGEGPGLLIDDYNILERVDDIRLLTAVAESGLLEALEEKGVTLSMLEKSLPLVEQLGLLRGLAWTLTPSSPINGILVNLVAPLLIEPAPYLMGPIASVVRLPSLFWSGLGGSLVALNLYGAFSVDDGEISVPLAVLAAPLLFLGYITSGGSLPSIPMPSAPSTETSSETSSSFELPSFGVPSLPVPSVPVPSFSAPALPSLPVEVPSIKGIAKRNKEKFLAGEELAGETLVTRKQNKSRLRI